MTTPGDDARGIKSVRKVLVHKKEVLCSGKKRGGYLVRGSRSRKGDTGKVPSREVLRRRWGGEIVFNLQLGAGVRWRERKVNFSNGE